MENLSTQNLVELLKSHIELLGELGELLESEREAIVSWNVESTAELTPQKDELLRKQNMLDQALKTLAPIVQAELGASDSSLSSIIAACSDQSLCDELASIKDELTSRATSIQQTNLALKILYSTNLRMIRQTYERFGYAPTTSNYGASYGGASSSQKYIQSSSTIALG